MRNYNNYLVRRRLVNLTNVPVIMTIIMIIKRRRKRIRIKLECRAIQAMRTQSFLFQRLSIALQRYLAIMWFYVIFMSYVILYLFVFLCTLCTILIINKIRITHSCCTRASSAPTIRTCSYSRLFSTFLAFNNN